MGTAFHRMVGGSAIALTRQDLDLTNLGAIAPLLDELDPEFVINCAAYTQVDRAEDEEALANLVNGEAVGRLAEWCSKNRRPFLTFSTDYVFDGTSDHPYLETSPTNPINAYGRSKRIGEVLALGHDALVVRTSWVISGTHPSFVSKIIDASRTRPLSVVDDQFGRPTIATDLARASYEALTGGGTGLVHITNQGTASWFDLATAAVASAGGDPGRITRCSTTEYPTKAQRPANSVLDSGRLGELGVAPMPEWSRSLPDVVDQIGTWLNTVEG